MSKHTYANNQVVKFSVDVAEGKKLSGLGVIRGVASEFVPVVGATYIIEPTKLTGNVEMPNPDYPFSFFCLNESFIKSYPHFKKG